MDARPYLLAISLGVWPLGVVAAQEATPAQTLTVTKIERLKQPRRFENADLRDELEHLAREAKINLYIQKEVCGAFTLAIDEPVAPYEALNRIAEKVHLFFEARPDNGYTVWAKADFKPSADAKPVAEKPAGANWTTPDGVAAATAEMAAKMTETVAKVDESLAEYNAKPETAARRAKFYKNFYDALIKEGFNKEDAMRLTVAAAYPDKPTENGSGNK